MFQFAARFPRPRRETQACSPTPTGSASGNNSTKSAPARACYSPKRCVVLRQMKLTRITVNPQQMGGVPCIRGLRIPVATVVGMVADEMTEAEILKAYPDLKHEDIREALQFAAEAVRERELPLVPGD